MTGDLDLLRQFARENSQDAFTEIVRRHVNLVYSAALRQVRAPQLAEEVAQSVFTDLARVAATPSSPAILTPWLYAVTRRTAIDVVRKESRRQLREQIAVEMTNMNATAADWTRIEPLLDDALAALDETDRSAILLRYFENKNLREVGASLNISDDAAQKRVSRAVEKLGEFFSKRGVSVGAGGLAIVISANAVQSAPVGLAATISAAAVLAGTAVHTSTLIAATKTIAMTTLQKTIIAATLTAAIGTGIFEAHQNSQLREQVQTFQQQQAPLAEQIQQMKGEREKLAVRLTSLADEIENQKGNSTELELLKLRGEVTLLRNNLREADKLGEQPARVTNGAPVGEFDELGGFTFLDPSTNEFARSLNYSFGNAQRKYMLNQLDVLKQKVSLSEDQEKSVRDLLLQFVESWAKPKTGKTSEEFEAMTDQGKQLEIQIKQLLSPQQQIAYADIAQGKNLARARYQASIELLDMQKVIALTSVQQQSAFDALAPLYQASFPELFNPLQQHPVDYQEELVALQTILTPDELKTYRDYCQSLVFTNQNH